MTCINYAGDFLTGKNFEKQIEEFLKEDVNFNINKDQYYEII